MTPATPIRSIAPDDWNDSAIAEAAAILLAGGVVAFPTETVYGLGADATNPSAVSRIFTAKGRPSTNPLIVHADGVDLARRCVSLWPEEAELLARRFWPGPLTLVLPRSRIVPDLVTGGRPTVGVRIPDVGVARFLISRIGRPLAAPSANRSTRISPTKAEHVSRDLDGRIDLILDAGPTRVGLESTVLDLSGNQPRILRPGPIDAEVIEAELGRPVIGSATPESLAIETRAAASPGLMGVHYAPTTRAIRLEPGEPIPERFLSGAPVALIVIGPPGDAIGSLLRPVFRVEFAEPLRAARGLYDAMHEGDRSGASVIVVRLPPDLLPWKAIRDRLIRATTSILPESTLDSSGSMPNA